MQERLNMSKFWGATLWVPSKWAYQNKKFSTVLAKNAAF